MATRNRYPTGVRPLLIEETARRKAVEALFVSALEEAGFAEIVVPILDFAEPYAALDARENRARSYRFVDRDGELVSVRSDFTPMVARALAPLLTPGSLPLRVCYRGEVVRCEASQLGADRELFQIGAEVIGEGSAASDVAILRLTATLLEALGLRPFVSFTDASHVARFDEQTRLALVTKRAAGATPLFARKLIAGTATLDDVSDFDPAAGLRLQRIVAELDGDPRFALHLDDVEPGAGYYTGLRFRAFGPDARTPIARGGRYDTLYGRFGTPAPAAGFTFTIDALTAEALAAAETLPERAVS
jgi:ATP phosphoribosyltransferase regulatory subunit